MDLGVNIDHIAVLREARKINDPNPMDALGICKLAGADQITVHLREDRRHIHDNDLTNIINISPLPVNLECSINEKMIDIAIQEKPHRVTLVPENRQEVTTEGGLDLEKNFENIKKAINNLQKNEIEVSLFIDPCCKMVTISKELNAQWIELHTGSYANIFAMLNTGLDKTHHSIKELELPRNSLKEKLQKSLYEIQKASQTAIKLDLKVAAGHGLNYQNVQNILLIDQICELNIGQSIIARSVFTGLHEAIESMRKIVKNKG